MHPHPFHPPSYMAHILAANSLCPTSRRCAPLRLCFVYAFAGCWFRALALVGGAGAELGKAEDALKLTEAETAHARTELKRERASLQAHNPSRPHPALRLSAFPLPGAESAEYTAVAQP